MNGFVVGGIYDTGMVLWLHHRFDLDSLGAGLVFLGAVLPSFIASPAAGWLADKSSAKWPATLGTALLIPIFGLMAISGPLALFVALMVLLGESRTTIEAELVSAPSKLRLTSFRYPRILTFFLSHSHPARSLARRLLHTRSRSRSHIRSLQPLLLHRLRHRTSPSPLFHPILTSFSLSHRVPSSQVKLLEPSESQRVGSQSASSTASSVSSSSPSLSCT